MSPDFGHLRLNSDEPVALFKNQTIRLAVLTLAAFKVVVQPWLTPKRLIKRHALPSVATWQELVYRSRVHQLVDVSDRAVEVFQRDADRD